MSQESNQNLKDIKIRLIQWNENERKRRMHYIYILLVWIAAFLFILPIFLLCRILPKWVPCKLIIFLILVSALGGSIYLYWDLLKRDPTDYDRLQLDPPSPPPSQTSSQHVVYNIGACINSSCCSQGTVWDPVNSYCTSTTISDYSHNDISNSAVTTPPYFGYLSNTASDFSNRVSRMFDSN